MFKENEIVLLNNINETLKTICQRLGGVSISLDNLTKALKK